MGKWEWLVVFGDFHVGWTRPGQPGSRGSGPKVVTGRGTASAATGVCVLPPACFSGPVQRDQLKSTGGCPDRAAAESQGLSHGPFQRAEGHPPETAHPVLSLRPQYFKYEFPEGVDSVIVKVTSNKAFPCSVISIQDVLVSALSSYTPPVVAGLLPRGDTAQALHLLPPL